MYKNIKKHIHSINFITLLFISSLLLISCKSSPKLLVFPQKKGNMIFIKPVDTKTSAIPFFSIDFTTFIDKGEIINDSSLKYSIIVKDMSAKNIEELNFDFLFGDNNIHLSHTTLYIESIKKSAIKIRFESVLSADEAKSIIETNDSLLIHIFNEDGTYSQTIPLVKFKEQLNDLRIYF